MKHQKGFTLIELIVVIVILGILAATALPKFVNLSSDARVASMKALEGSMRAANAMVYGKAQIGNLMTGTTVTTKNVLFNGTNIATAYGYPATVADLVSAMDLGADFTVDPTNSWIISNGAPDITRCNIKFTPATSLTVPPVIAPTGNLAGC